MTQFSCPRCGYDDVTPVPGFDPTQARRRVLPAIAALVVVLLWALAYLTVPVVVTIQGGSFNWPMTLLVGLMWPLAVVIVVTVRRVAMERAQSDAYCCERCEARWPRRESQAV